MSVILNSQIKSINDNVVHRYATLWYLKRFDGTILRFTDHNTDITFKGELFLAAVGFQVSATQRMSGLAESNKEGIGIIVPLGVSGINESDLRGGKYRNASVTEYLVDWQYPWINELYKTKYTLSDIVNDGLSWKTNMISQTKFLRLPTGKIYNRNCRHLLGSVDHVLSGTGASEQLVMFDSRCRFNLNGKLTEAYNEVDAKISATVVSVANARRRFGVNISANYLANVFRYGIASFHTTGLNAGQSYEIASNAVGSTDCEITTFIDIPYDIVVDDVVTLIVGCGKTVAQCKDKFNNHHNFGGFPDIPGADRAMFVPDRV